MAAPGSAGVHSKEDNVLSLTVDAAATAGRGAAMIAPKTPADSETQLERILTSLSEDKAEEIVQIDLRGKSAIGDFMIVCSGRSTRQVTAIAEKLSERLKSELGVMTKVEGKDSGDWVLLDTGDVIVHVFRPEVREFYQLEKMWVPASKTASADS
jgi:ribosome-associated protein